MNVDKDMLLSYLNRLIDRIFKLIPLKQEKNQFIDVYLDSLIFEMIGNKGIIDQFKNHGDYLSLIGTLNSLKNRDEFKQYRSDVFKCIKITEKLRDSLRSQVINDE